MFFKNTAGKVELFAFDATTGLPKTGDSANITMYVNKDDGGVNALTDTSAAELSSTNAAGWYVCDYTNTEANAEKLHFTGKSSTSNIVVVGRVVYTLPQTGVLAPATLGRTAVVDASGLIDANTVKVGPTGSGTAQTARDIGASVLLSSGTGTGQVKLSSGYVAPNWGDVGNPTTTVGLSGTTIATSQVVASVSGAVGSVTGAVGSVTGNVGGNVTGSVGSVVGAVGSVTGAVGSVTGAVGSVTGNVGGNVTGTVASVVGAVGSVTGLTASDVGAIKVKTDQLTFTKTNELDSNIQSVNGVTITGDGDGTPFDVV